MKHGKLWVKDIKQKKVTSEVPMSKQFLEYHSKFGDFYTQDKINTITEDQVKEGLSNFDVLIEKEEISQI